MFYIVRQDGSLNRAFYKIEDAEEYVKIFTDRSQCKCYSCEHFCEMKEKYGSRIWGPYDIVEVCDTKCVEDGDNLFILLKYKKIIGTATTYKSIQDIFRENIRYKDYRSDDYHDKYRIVFCPLSKRYDNSKHYEYDSDRGYGTYQGEDDNGNWKDNDFVNNKF